MVSILSCIDALLDYALPAESALEEGLEVARNIAQVWTTSPLIVIRVILITITMFTRFQSRD